MTTRHLLRFALARPPLSHGDRPHLIAGPFDTVPGTTFQQAVDRADTDDSRAALAQEFLSSERYVGARLRTDNGKGVLSALANLLAHSRRGDGPDLADGLRISEAIARTALAEKSSVVAALTAVPVLPAWLMPEPKPGSPADRGIRPDATVTLPL